ncbi:tetratricopeptide repeat protein [Synechocystis sp. FACHB-383]|uniref:CHAT domain-containing protein n=1 Tax=Synechocystis sp. FACHB-383 TaxID=2692864 RepID=UPI001689F302|nr:tetratricopeptide repeat protein [Synechocystis sp. FACHB-383]MBD2654775.1 tetratricopeptide repeat protein [Synechocystis sp. FACHB-383]
MTLAEPKPQILLDVQGTLEEGDIKLDDGVLLDVHEIEITSNSPIFISAESDDFDAFLMMLDSEGNKLGENNIFDDTRIGIFMEEVKVGKYQIGVINYKPEKAGQYQLLVKIPTSSELIVLKADIWFNQAQSLEIKNSSESLYKAIELYENSLILYRQLDDGQNVSIVLNNIGSLYSDLGDKQKALDYYNQALVISKQVGDLSSEGTNLNNIGLIYSDLGDKQKALDYYNQALVISKQVGDLSSEGTNLNNIGLIHSDLGDKQKALDYYNQALVIRKQVGDLSGEGTTLNNIGNIYHDLGDRRKAIDYYNQALVISKQVGDLSGESITLNNIGGIYSDLGDKQKALDYFNQALVISKQIGDLFGEGKILNNIGSLYSGLGDKQKALDYYNQALVISKQVGDLSSEGTTLSNIGLIYSDLGDRRKAIDYYNQALVIRKQVGDLSGEGTTLNNIGNIYHDLGDRRKAIDYYNQALVIRKQVGDLSGEGTTLNNIGNIYHDLGDRRKAIDYYNQALVISKQVGDLSSEGTTLNNIAGTYDDLGNNQKAFDYFSQALVIRKQVGDLFGETITLGNLGYLEFKNKQYEGAIKYINQSLSLLESVDINKFNDELQVSYFDTYSTGYKLLQKALVAQNQPTEAIAVAERGRARILVELLNQRFSNIENASSLRQPILSELQAVAKNSNSSLVTYSLIENLPGTSGEKENELYIYVISPDGKLEFRSFNLSNKDINLSKLVETARQTIAQAPPDRPQQSRGNNSGAINSLENIAVGDYVKLQGEFPSDEPWQVVAIDQDKQTVNLDQTRREEPLENVSISRIASKTDTSLRQLHQILIEPIADLLPQDPAERVIFMPQGALFGVPFAALQDAQGRYLIEKHTILTSPSIQVLAQTAAQNQRLAKQGQSKSKALVVGNPYPYPDNLKSLENAGAEAEQIASLLGVQPLLGKKATEAEVLAQMPQADIIHFATHASFNDQRGLSSAIYLTAEPGAPDDGLFQTPGRITAEDIFNQFEDNPLNARLVVLSACDTGQGEITGDGVIGLSRSLIAGGVPSVLVSLWSVDDASTKTLMTEFYRQWQQQGVDKATALRNAMLETKAAYPDPYYWSGFTLIGEAD